MSNVKKYAELEMDIIEQSIEDAIITPFREEILALVDAFGKSGQSGGSAPYTARAICQALEKLMLFKPISPITGVDEEWSNVSNMCQSGIVYQNKRCGSLFKTDKDKPYYLDAIVFQGEKEYDTWTGHCYIDNIDFKEIGSSQEVNFPFEPKTFYVDVISIPITETEAEERDINYYYSNDDGTYYYNVLKDPCQLDEVFKYYNRKEV